MAKQIRGLIFSLINFAKIYFKCNSQVEKPSLRSLERKNIKTKTVPICETKSSLYQHFKNDLTNQKEWNEQQDRK